MASKNPSVEINLTAAKTAARQMQAEWIRWKGARDEKMKSQALSKYSAAFTSCKVYLENYLKNLYPNEKVPSKIAQDVRSIATDMDRIENMNEAMMQKIFKDIDQLARDAAAA